MRPHDAFASALRPLLVAAILAIACGSNGSRSPPAPAVPTKLSGIGDSIMQGVDVTVPGESPDESFAQGTDPSVHSIFARYRELGGLAAGEEFVSISGAKMVADAVAQAQSICAQAVKPDRIVMLLGANDVCSRGSVDRLYPVETFREAVRSALDTLGSTACGLPAGSWVHVLSMPRVDLLRAAGLKKSDAQCQVVWSISSFCQIVTQETNQTTLEVIGARIDEYNQAIADAVAAADLAHASAGVHFTTDWRGPSSQQPDTSVGTVTFGPDDLSRIDCFHPSLVGQQKLACIAWESWEFPGAGVASCL